MKKVDLFIPKGYANDEANLLIGINGVNYLLPRGKTSQVPGEVAAEFQRAQRAQARMDERMEQLAEKMHNA